MSRYLKVGPAKVRFFAKGDDSPLDILEASDAEGLPDGVGWSDYLVRVEAGAQVVFTVEGKAPPLKRLWVNGRAAAPGEFPVSSPSVYIAVEDNEETHKARFHLIDADRDEEEVVLVNLDDTGHVLVEAAEVVGEVAAEAGGGFFHNLATGFGLWGGGGDKPEPAESTLGGHSEYTPTSYAPSDSGGGWFGGGGGGDSGGGDCGGGGDGGGGGGD